MPQGSNKINLEGHRIGRWLVLRDSGLRSIAGRNILWECKCDCGTERNVKSQSLLSGKSTCCGCKYIERLRARRPSDAFINSSGNYRHGYARARNQSPEYRAWYGIKTRCFNTNRKDYERYGGRGITMCTEWEGSFEAFLRDMGERPGGTSIDRINNSGNYEPGNCRWATVKEQANNRRPYSEWKKSKKEA